MKACCERSESRAFSGICHPAATPFHGNCFIPRKESEYGRTAFERRRKVDFAGTRAWIASVEDLVLSKLQWARDAESEQQMRDVRQLLAPPR
jgi:hypothetical protein